MVKYIPRWEVIAEINMELAKRRKWTHFQTAYQKLVVDAEIKLLEKLKKQIEKIN